MASCSSDGLPRVHGALSVKELREECQVRDLKLKGRQTKNDFLTLLLDDSILLSQTAAYKEFQRLKEQLKNERPDKEKLSKILAADRANQQAKREEKKQQKQVAKEMALHTLDCPPHVHKCKLAATCNLSGRSSRAQCNVSSGECVRFPVAFSCLKCDFDICQACFALESLPESERKKKKKVLEQKRAAKRKREEEDRKVMIEKRRKIEAKREAQRLQDEKEKLELVKSLQNMPQKIQKPEGKHKNSNKVLKYVVWSSCGYGNDGWHSYDGPPSKEFDSSYSTIKDANDRARYLFYVENTWGLGVEEILECDNSYSMMANRYDISEHFVDGLVHLSVSPPDSEVWTVAAVPKAAFKHLDNATSRNSEDEDSYERYDDDCYVSRFAF